MVCSPETAARFSAVGYFFAVDVQDDQHVPVGMIGTYWGGTPAESWTSLEALEAHPELKGHAERFKKLQAGIADLKTRYESETLPKWKKEHDEWEQDRRQGLRANAEGMDGGRSRSQKIRRG